MSTALPADRKARERGQIREDSKVWDGRVSFTFTRLFDACPHSALLYDVHSPPSSIEMERGSALHAIQERARRHQIEVGDNYIPADIAKDFTNDVLAEYHVPFSEHDNIREMAYRWASEWECSPEAMVAVEQLFEIDLPGGLILRARVDCGLLSPDGRHLQVIDTKTSRSMPKYEDIARKRPDSDAYMAKGIQLVIYALAMTRGIPIIELPDGTEVRSTHGPLAPKARKIDVRYEYPAIPQKTGQYAGLCSRREMNLELIELEQAADSLTALGERLAMTIAKEHWPARSGSHCNMCPARLLCPIPPALRTYRDADDLIMVSDLETLEEASERAEWVFHMKKLVGAVEGDVKNWSKRHDGAPVPFGRDLEYAYVPNASTTFDRDRLADDIAAGKQVDPRDYEKTRTGTRWGKRTRTEGGSDE